MCRGATNRPSLTGATAHTTWHCRHVVHLLPACVCISINLGQEDFLGLCWRIILAPHLKPGKQAPWNIDGSPPPTHPQTVIPDTRLASPAWTLSLSLRGYTPPPYPWTKPSRSLSHRRPQAKNSKAQTMGAHVIFARGTCYNSAVGCGVLRCANRSLLRAVSAVCVQRTSYFVTVISPSLWVPNQLVADVLHAVCVAVPVRDGRFVAPRHMFFVKITF